MTSIAAAKKDVRARVRSARDARSAHERAAAALRLERAAAALLPQQPALVSAYQSLESEPGTRALISTILARGHRLVLPRITNRGLLWVEVDDGSEFARGPLGISEPTGPSLPEYPSPLREAAVLFMPGLSVDRHGRRLGQGGGYYDRSLSAVPAHKDGGPQRVALLFDDEYVDEVPAEEHDCRVDLVVTPARTITIAP
jgi:5-formyltetrahydrofolate cyclo-ligase